jgi:hypothetical protein
MNGDTPPVQAKVTALVVTAPTVGAFTTARTGTAAASRQAAAMVSFARDSI